MLTSQDRCFNLPCLKVNDNRQPGNSELDHSNEATEPSLPAFGLMHVAMATLQFHTLQNN